MIPDKEGVYEWFDDNGVKQLVFVCNPYKTINELELRVPYKGSYYSVRGTPASKFIDESGRSYIIEEYPAEWPERWGNYLGKVEDFKPEELYG